MVARSLQLLVPREKTDARAMPQDRSAARIPLWTTLFVDAEPCEHFEVTGMGGCADTRNPVHSDKIEDGRNVDWIRQILAAQFCYTLPSTCPFLKRLFLFEVAIHL